LPEYFAPFQPNSNLANETVRLIAQSGENDPWAALAKSISAAAVGIAQKRREQAANFVDPQQAIALGLPATVPGRPLPSGAVGPAQPMPLQEAFPKGIPKDIFNEKLNQISKENISKEATNRAMEALNLKGQQASQLEFQKNHTQATKEIIENFPAIKKMGYQEGDYIPNRFIQDQNKPISANIGMKEEQFQTRRWDKLKTYMDAAKASSRSLIGTAVQNNMRSRRALIATDDVNAIPQQLDAAFADYASVMKGGVPDQESMRHIRVDTLASKWANLKQLITSKPQSINTPEVQGKLKQMLQEVVKVDDQAITKWWDYNEKANKDILSNKEFKSMWTEMRKEAMGLASDVPSEGGIPKIGDIMDGHKFKGGNPADAKNWEKV